ncbi:MAG: TonB-dependent receptor [Acidobacteriia bacterium]|nr:TonB-dependent receptor [Terriglobia bacterium]
MLSSRARWNVVCLVVLLCLTSSTLMFAQSTGGRILGRVADPTGAVLAHVKVTAVNDATGVSRNTETNDTGDYVFPEVPVGAYSLSFELAGFKKDVRHGVELQLNQILTLNMVMQIGQTQEVVDVTSEAPLVDTTSTQLGTVVNDRAIVQLPLNERDTYQFLSLQPGVSSQTGTDLYYGSSNVGSVSVNGGRGRANNFSVNGGDANDMFANLPTVQPSPDSVQEFRILTNTFDAEYGRNSGAVVNVVTKSGTNRLHGDVYEFHRNRPLNAKGYFDTSKAAFIMNQFGGTLGGPIKKDRTFFFGSYEGLRRVRGVSGTTVSVPDALERTGNFSEGPAFNGVIGDQTVADVLSTRANGQCLTDITNAGGEAPFAGANYSDVFPGNVIPSSCQDPVAADLLRFVPSANTSSGFFQAVLTGRDRQDQTTFRFDHTINSKQQFSAYFYFSDQSNFSPFNNFQAAGANVPGFGADSKNRYQQWNLSHTWTVSNSLVNEFRFSYMREAQRTFNHSQHTNNVTDSCSSAVAQFCFTGVSDASIINTDPTTNPLAGTQFANKIGITPGLGAGREGVPDVTVSGGFTIGNNFEGELPQVGNSFQWTDSLTKVKGNHTMKFGVDLRRMRFDQTLYFEVSGYYNYFGGGTNDVNYANNLYPNYLLGLPDTYQQGAAQAENVRTTSVYLFAQDSWKLRPNLTLNYGLRWELNTPLTDIGHHVQTYRPGKSTSIYPCSIGAYGEAVLGTNDCTSVFPTGLLVPGDKGVPAGMTQTYYKAFAPRIGIAWSPGKSGKTSIRAGWGMFYNPIEQLVLEQFSAEPPFGGSTFLVETLFNTPFMPQAGGFVYPNPFGGILNPPRGQPVDWSVFRPILLFGEFQPHMRSQYSEQYNFGIQRQLARDLVLQLGYVGSQGHRLLVSNDLNRATPQTCLDIASIAAGDPSGNSVSSFNTPGATCNQFAEDNQFTVVVPNGFNFHMPNGTTVAGTGQTVNFVGIRPYSSPNCQPDGTNCPPDGVPVFSNIFAQDTIANSSYNSFQANLEKRFSNGLQLQAAYTFSKSIDQASSFEDILNPFNPLRTRALSVFNAAHRFVLSYYYELPIRKFSGAAGQVLNGWAVSGITQFQSGFPIHLQSFDDNELTSSIDFASAGEPDQIAAFHKLDPRKNSNNYGFDPNSFTSNASDSSQPLCSAGAAFNCYQPSLFGRYGSAPRTICCGPGLNDWDISVQKQFRVTEDKHLEFRWDIFNAANHTRFFNPDGNVTDGTDFGRVKGAGDPRLMQVALKFYF